MNRRNWSRSTCVRKRLFLAIARSPESRSPCNPPALATAFVHDRRIVKRHGLGCRWRFVSWSESTLSAGAFEVVRHCTSIPCGRSVRASRRRIVTPISAWCSSLIVPRRNRRSRHSNSESSRAERLSQTMGPPLFDSGSMWRLYEDEAMLSIRFQCSGLGKAVRISG